MYLVTDDGVSTQDLEDLTTGLVNDLYQKFPIYLAFAKEFMQKCLEQKHVELTTTTYKCSLIYKLGLSDKLAYLYSRDLSYNHGKPTLIIVVNMAACRLCKQVFEYHHPIDMIKFVAVSYTHLDVYKRQHLMKVNRELLFEK